MKKSTGLRLVGGLILLFNIWLVGRYNIQGIPVLLITFGFAAGYEYLIVKPASKTLNNSGNNKKEIEIEYMCSECGQETSPRQYDNQSNMFCPDCGGQIEQKSTLVVPA